MSQPGPAQNAEVARLVAEAAYDWQQASTWLLWAGDPSIVRAVQAQSVLLRALTYLIAGRQCLQRACALVDDPALRTTCEAYIRQLDRAAERALERMRSVEKQARDG